MADLSHILPKEVRPLKIDEEQKVSEIFNRYFGFKAAAEINGKRLNRSFGLIGQEQHLTRYPGDTIMYNILCSRAVKETIVKAGGKPFMWRVGHSFFKK